MSKLPLFTTKDTCETLHVTTVAKHQGVIIMYTGFIEREGRRERVSMSPRNVVKGVDCQILWRDDEGNAIRGRILRRLAGNTDLIVSPAGTVAQIRIKAERVIQA